MFDLKGKPSNSIILARTISTSLFAAVTAGIWDVWWHGALGRESFWAPPHILLYLSVIVAVILGVYGWYRTKEKLWRRLALLLVLIPVSAPIDELWHRLFGIENVASPAIVWSPPHLLLIGAITGSFIMLLPLLKQDQDITARRLFGSMAIASIAALLIFLVSPLDPTGPNHLLGFWGAGFMAFVFIGALLFAGKWLPGIAPAFSLSLTYLAIIAINFGEEINAKVIVAPHDHAPSWVLIFATLVPAVFLDLTQRLPLWARSIGASILWSGILYGVASYFFEPQFQYLPSQTLIAVAISIIGGVFASAIVSRSNLKKEGWLL